MAPDPKNSNEGKSKFLIFTGVASLFAEDKYTAINAKTIPIILTKPTLSLYTIIPKIIGITTDIFPEIEATDNPFLCAVIPITLKIAINKKPNKTAPKNQDWVGISVISTRALEVKKPILQAIA